MEEALNCMGSWRTKAKLRAELRKAAEDKARYDQSRIDKRRAREERRKRRREALESV